MILIILFSCFTFLAWRYLPWLVAFTIFFLPLYQVRLFVFGWPTNLLEGMVLVLILMWSIRRRFAGPVTAHTPQCSPWLRLWGPQRCATRFIVSLVLPLLVAATISAIISPNQLGAWTDWRVYFIEPVLFFFMIRDLVRVEKNRDLFLLAAAGLLGWVGLLIIIQKFTGFLVPPYWFSIGRMTGPYSYPNAVGLLVSALAPFVSISAFSDKRLAFRGFCFAGGIAGVVAVVLAQSKGAMLGLAAAALVTGLYYIRKHWRVWLPIIIFIILIIYNLIPNTYNLKPTKPHIFGQQQNVGESLAIRKIVWRETWPMLKDHWFLGAGLSGYQIAMKPYHKALYTEIFMYPHNFLLNIWSELGLLGLIAVLWLGIILLCHCERPKGSVAILNDAGDRHVPLASGTRDDKLRGLHATCYMVVAVLASLTVHGLVDVPYFKNDLALLFWLVAAFVV